MLDIAHYLSQAFEFKIKFYACEVNSNWGKYNDLTFIKSVL